MIKQLHPGFLVWSPAGALPNKQHTSIKAAQDEAERLAKQKPGQRFYVMVPIGAAEAVIAPPVSKFEPILPVMEVRPTDMDDEIPF